MCFLRQPRLIFFHLVHPSSITTYHARRAVGAEPIPFIAGPHRETNSRAQAHFSYFKDLQQREWLLLWSPAQHPLARSHLCFIAIRQQISPGCEKLFCVFVPSLRCWRKRKSQPSKQPAQACSKGARQATGEHVALHQARESQYQRCGSLIRK